MRAVASKQLKDALLQNLSIKQSHECFVRFDRLNVTKVSTVDLLEKAKVFEKCTALALCRLSEQILLLNFWYFLFVFILLQQYDPHLYYATLGAGSHAIKTTPLPFRTCTFVI